MRAPQLPRHSASTWLTVSIVLLGSTLTLINWVNVHRRESTQLKRALVDHTELIEASIHDRMLTYEAVLHSAAGLIHASEHVTETEWRAFTRQLRLAASYPGLEGVGYALRVPVGEPSPPVDPELKALSNSTPVADRDRTAIVYIEPSTERNRRVLGFDMMSEPTRRGAMERARDTAAAALTPRITLLRTSTAPSEAAFIVYLPVYKSETPPSSVDERRAQLVGFVYAPFRAATFMNSVLGRLPDEITLEIRDAGTDGLLYQHGSAAGSVLAHESILPMFGHRWLIRVGAHPSFVERQRSDYGMWTLVTGGVTTLLVAALVLTLALNRQHLANRLKAEVTAREREHYAAAILDNSLDAYVAIDEQDRIREWNRQAEATFGWQRSEVMGRCLADTLIPERRRAEHLNALRTFRERTPRLVGRRIEMPALHADGKEITIELSILAIPAKDNVLFVASIRDVTESRRQQAEIIEMNATLEQRVAQRTAALAEANRNLQDANEQLEAFARNVSHDLRAPLRAIHGYTGIVLDECPTLDARCRDHLARVQTSVQRMQRIIEDLLRLAFVRRQPIKKERVNLWSVCRQVLGELDCKLATVQAIPEDLGEVCADPGLLAQALKNLLSNAIKFSAESARPTITVGTETDRDERVYYVRDNGVGFDPRYADKLFQVFQRLHSADKFEGTGLGLTIVKTIIERHGGRVWATSTPGEGATFWFTLPSAECAELVS